MSFSFTPKKRIRKRVEYLRIQKASKKIHSKYFILSYCFGTNPSVPRLGIVATKKIGNAVVRNRGKRLVRETFRRHQHLLSNKLEIVLILKQGIHQASQSEIDQEFLSTIKKIKSNHATQRAYQKI